MRIRETKRRGALSAIRTFHQVTTCLRASRTLLRSPTSRQSAPFPSPQSPLFGRAKVDDRLGGGATNKSCPRFIPPTVDRVAVDLPHSTLSNWQCIDQTIADKPEFRPKHSVLMQAEPLDDLGCYMRLPRGFTAPKRGFGQFGWKAGGPRIHWCVHRQQLYLFVRIECQ